MTKPLRKCLHASDGCIESELRLESDSEEELAGDEEPLVFQIQKSIQMVIYGKQEVIVDSFQHLQVLMSGWTVMLCQISKMILLP